MHLKGRTDDRFTLVASSLQQVKRHFKLTPVMEQLAKQYWPGALSIVVTPKYAIRVPVMDIPRQLAKKLGVPLLATSLNISGQPPVFDLQQPVETTLGLSLLRDPDISVIDIGPLPKKLPSTVVECFRGGYVVHRQGSVKL